MYKKETHILLGSGGSCQTDGRYMQSAACFSIIVNKGWFEDGPPPAKSWLKRESTLQKYDFDKPSKFKKKQMG